jgi:hypothetical protein
MPCILNLTVHPDMTQHHMVLVDWYLLNNSDQQYNYSLLVLLFVGLQDNRIQQHRVLCNLYYLFLHSKILVDNHYNHSVRCFQQSLTWCQRPATNYTGGRCWPGTYCLAGSSYPTPCDGGKYCSLYGLTNPKLRNST